MPHRSAAAFVGRRVESLIAPYLAALQTRLKPNGIQVGSYPILGQGVFVSIVGRDILTPGSGRLRSRPINDIIPDPTLSDFQFVKAAMVNHKRESG